MIKLGFYGAAGEVTGSCYILTTDRAQVMVDMGMHQGEKVADEHNRRLPPADLSRINAVVLTHAHLDHCGRLPLLIQNGYRGEIHCTAPTSGITEIILRDSARLQAEDYARSLRHLHNHHNNRNHPEPLYSELDVEHTLPLLRTLAYDEVRTIADGISIKLVDAGHILGASSVQMTVNDGSRTITIVFSGDVGQVGAPILRDPVTPTPADVVLLESTYGDRDHQPLDRTVDQLLAILRDAQASGGKVIIPAFAVGRAQDLIFHIGEFLRNHQLKNINVYLDSPMARSVSALYSRYTNVYDARATELLSEHLQPLNFPGMSYIETVDESKQLNEAKGPMVVVAANGMCSGGRVMHHLLHNLPNPHTHVVIAGYQGQGTLGRRLVERANEVSIFGQRVSVHAKVHTLSGFSAHAGQTGLLNWAAPFQTSKPRFFLTHGEDRPRTALHDKLQARFNLNSAMPHYGEVVEL
ncbi:MAG TPA: MBL fold metallo-hydrolase [Lacipirellulaceae bacterium]|nr:MBL fold metallo-hydrolase [Lacipirellulaceae bacterium]